MTKRLAMHVVAPGAYKLMKEMDAMIKTSGVNPLHLELIKIRASQLNGCAYCLDQHTKDSLKLGEDARRLYVLSAWREAGEWFTEEEQVILQLTEEITQIGQHGVSDDVYSRGLALFGENKLAHLILAAMNINGWNRLGVGLNLHPAK